MEDIMWIKAEINPKYEVNEKGEVRHAENKRPLKQRLNRYGYPTVVLSVSHNKRQYPCVHRLVAMAFIPNPDDLPCVNHKDEDKTNNSVENLEWCTPAYNSAYGTAVERSAKNRSKPVVAFKNGKAVAQYSSITKAASSVGIEDGLISAVLHGRQHTAGGYGWAYERG